jgi:hypothetical protein
MDSPSTTVGSFGFSVAIAIFTALMVGLLVYAVVSKRNTVPYGSIVSYGKEGFQGPTRGVSDFPCGQESAEAVALSEMFASRMSTTEEGSADLVELKQILSKMCCMKHDLMSVSQVVQASLYLPYTNSHDRENPADTVGRCFTKGIPPRDLDITFATWKDRGLLLLNKLCTSYNFSAAESDRANAHFMATWTDVFSIAKSVCLTSKDMGSKTGSPRDLNGFTPESVKDLGSYNGYY